LSPARRALVTGGTKGIGRAVAFRLASEGAAVTCVYRSDETGRKLCEAAAREKGLTLRFEKADLASADEVNKLFTRLSQDDREPDYLINSAGMTRDAPFIFTGVADFDAIIDANLKSAFLVTQQAAKAMVRRRFGRIISFASPAALIGNEGQSAYAAAKAGLIGLSRTLARELARYQITVNVISPGIIPTEMTAKLSDEKMAELVQRTPLRRVGTPEEVAGLVRFLCHDLAAYITGQCLAIDGGLT
jgi:3-oxoacyl-[acyl-carrier protein] reductase